MKKLDRFDSPVIDSGREVRLCFSKYKVVISDKFPMLEGSWFNF